MPPPMATPRRTRGSRARKRISVSGLAENMFSKARERSRRTGPSSVQPTMDRASKASSVPFTQSIFLRSRTFTLTSILESASRLRKAFRMNESGNFFQTFSHPWAGPENFIGGVSEAPPLFNGGNRLKISPMLGRRRAFRSHACLDDHLRRFGHDELV